MAFRPEIQRRSIKVALTAGTILTAINHVDVLLSGPVVGTTIGKIVLTYCVPYCVSTYAGVEAMRKQRHV